MAQFEQVLFLLQFTIIVIIFGVKLLNLFSGWKLYDWQGIIALLIATLFFYGMNLIVTPLAYEDLFISQLSKLEILPFLVIVIFSIIEAFTMAQMQIAGRQRYGGNSEYARR